MQSLSKFITTSGPIPEVKKPTPINDWENVAYWEESVKSKAFANMFGLFQIQLGGLEKL